MSIRDISIVTMVCLGVIFATGVESYGEPMMSPTLKERMQQHIEEVKHKNPEKYETLVQNSGGKITGCRSCHVKVGRGKIEK